MPKKLLNFTDKSVKVRIIEGPLYLKSRHPGHLWTGKEIGEFCEAQQETVTRLLSVLEQEALIQKDGRNILIPSKLKLLEKARELYP